MKVPAAMPMKVLVVDDEPLARENLRLLLAADPQVEVVSECAGPEAVALIARHRPDILFLDVQMPELDGFALLDLVGPDAVPAVVFVTAFDRYAVQAFEVHALDYLLKPFTDARFEVKDFLPEVKAPVTLIHGDEDELVPVEMSRELKRYWGDQAELIEIPEGGHNDIYALGAETIKQELERIAKSLNVGHYVAYARRKVNGQDTWLYFNDDMVYKTDKPELGKPYLLFLKKIW